MDFDVRRNPALLKLDLYCKGMRLDDCCLVEEDGGRKILRTRAGLGSGLEVILPGGLWTNVPVAERFAQSSPYVLHREDGRVRAPPATASRSRRCELVAAPGLVRPQDHHRQADDPHRHAPGHLPGRLSGEGLRVLDREARRRPTASSARWA